MVSTSSFVVGMFFILAGVFFFALSIFEVWWLLFYGIPLVIIGIVFFLNKNEDKIEKRKDLKEKEYKQ